MCVPHNPEYPRWRKPCLCASGLHSQGLERFSNSTLQSLYRSILPFPPQRSPVPSGKGCLQRKRWQSELVSRISTDTSNMYVWQYNKRVDRVLLRGPGKDPISTLLPPGLPRLACILNISLSLHNIRHDYMILTRATGITVDGLWRSISFHRPLLRGRCISRSGASRDHTAIYGCRNHIRPGQLYV